MRVKVLRMYGEGEIPVYKTAGAAGADLYSPVDCEIPARSRVEIKLQIAVEIPRYHVGFIVPRSSMSMRHRQMLTNTPGTIDSDYRGELSIELYNDTDKQHYVSKGERVAQLVIVPYLHAEFVEVDRLDDTERGVGGFGSTGR